jgi:hypothetical protein
MRRAEPDRRAMRPHAALRRGSITIFVLVCLVAITSLCGVILRIGLAERQRLRGEEQRLQAEWLVESGLERAAARIAASRGDYRGETWDLSASDLGGPNSGRVTIAVETPKEPSARRQVRVQAEYPRDAPAPTRLTKVSTIAIGSAPKGESP